MEPTIDNILKFTIHRDSLGLAPLVIGTDLHSTYSLIDEEGVEDLDVVWDKKYAAPARHVNGSTLYSARLDQAEVKHRILIRGTSSAQLAAAKAVLKGSLAQFHFLADEEFDAEPKKTWSCDLAEITWIKSKARRRHLAAACDVTIPVYPTPAVS